MLVLGPPEMKYRIYFDFGLHLSFILVWIEFPWDVRGRGDQSDGRYKLQKGGCNRIFPISVNENLLKQICEICSVCSTHMLTKIGVANIHLQISSVYSYTILLGGKVSYGEKFF